MTMVLALAGSAVLGLAVGALAAIAGAATGVRPRRALRERRQLVLVGSCGISGIALAASLAGILVASPARLLLALTCAATALLLGFATWLLLVEPDDRGDDRVLDEPEWWPSFERDFDEWRRRARRPVGSRD